jgi:hypothetical protein
MLGISETASASCEEVGNVIRQITADKHASERAYKYRNGGEAGLPRLEMIYSQIIIRKRDCKSDINSDTKPNRDSRPEYGWKRQKKDRANDDL